MGVTCFLLGKWFQAAFVCRVGNSFAHAVHRKTRWASQLPTLHLAFQAARWRVVGSPILLIIFANRRGLLSIIW